jgi:hypothetical protein
MQSTRADRVVPAGLVQAPAQHGHGAASKIVEFSFNTSQEVAEILGELP